MDLSQEGLRGWCMTWQPVWQACSPMCRLSAQGTPYRWALANAIWPSLLRRTRSRWWLCALLETPPIHQGWVTQWMEVSIYVWWKWLLQMLAQLSSAQRQASLSSFTYLSYHISMRQGHTRTPRYFMPYSMTTYIAINQSYTICQANIHSIKLMKSNMSRK